MNLWSFSWGKWWSTLIDHGEHMTWRIWTMPKWGFFLHSSSFRSRGFREAGGRLQQLWRRGHQGLMGRNISPNKENQPILHAWYGWNARSLCQYYWTTWFSAPITGANCFGVAALTTFFWGNGAANVVYFRTICEQRAVLMIALIVIDTSDHHLGSAVMQSAWTFPLSNWSKVG